MAGRRERQRGAALLIFLILLVTAALTYVVTSLTPEAVEAQRKRKTQDALAQAREALIGYALQYRDEQITQGQLDRVYGFLPLPDLGSSRNNNAGCPQEGCDAANFAGNVPNTTVIGRLPWRILGLAPLRDGYGECLWLVVSGSHQRIQQVTPMNWDTLGQLDIVVANGTATLNSTLASAHDRPVAVIFSPGPPLPGQDRSTSGTDDVSQCGGNYNAANYLDPAAVALGGITNYLSGTNNATGITGDTDPSNDPDAPKSLLANGKVFVDTGNYFPNACQGSGCALAANDSGLPLTSEMLFDAIRKSANFRTDINTMLERMVSCLRDEIAAGNPPAATHGKIAGADNHACYGQNVDPLGYYPHYKEMVFVAVPGGGANVTVDGIAQANCAGALLYANQRGASQQRVALADKAAYANYLEGTNLASFSASGSTFAGAGRIERPAPGGQAREQDLVRCIPAGPSFVSVESPTLTTLGIGQLTAYDPATRTLTLGQPNVDSNSTPAAAHAIFGCAWQPEAHEAGSGVRAYFRFFIHDTGWPGDGFTFALVDGDANAANVCGAASQHMGYSGNNGSTPLIAFPKIGIEIDTLRNYRNNASFTDPPGFDPSYLGASPATTSYLNNGRADPDYTGGHIGIVYWGGELPISTGLACGTGCTSPQYCNAGICYLSPEMDDNVHGRSASAITPTRPPPQNPLAPATPATAPAGVYKLDPNLSQVPKLQDIHVRVELSRTQAVDSYNSRPVRAVATGNVSLNGLPTIDGIALQNGDRVLLTAQSDGKLNGVWVATTGDWTRASTEDEVADMPSGITWIVREGSANAWSYWRLANPAGYILAGSALNFGTALSIGKAAPPWKAVATAAIPLSGALTIGGTTLADNDLVLVTAQAAASENGIYKVNTGSAWTRIPMYQGTYTTKAWVLKQSATDASRIIKMGLTSQSLLDLDASFTPLLADTKPIYSPVTGNCTGNAICPNGQWCGIDNVCYRPAFRTLRLGFTNGQGTRDQMINVKDFATTWLP